MIASTIHPGLIFKIILVPVRSVLFVRSKLEFSQNKI